MGFNERDITARLIGKDDMSPVFDKAGRSSTSMGEKFKKAAKIGATALLAVGAVAIKFGADSVRAAAEAEAAQARLSDAFQRFPKLAGANIESFRKLNEQLMAKTRFDDDALASGQAVLAQFNLNAKQLKDMTPLMADYAAKTGKDIPTAAKTLGKAFLGNTRALKDLGIDVELTGNKAKDYAIIQDALNKKVGGFAKKDGKTAAGVAARMRNQFGELQEKIGNALLPILLKMGRWLLNKGIPALQRFGKWIGPKLRAFIEVAKDAIDRVKKSLSNNGETMERVKRIIKKLQEAWERIRPIVKKLAEVYLAYLVTVWKMIGRVITRIVLPAIERGIDAFNKVAGVVERVVDRIKSAWAKLPSFKINMPDMGKIPGFASGVRNFRGGWAVVGERGPELLNLPRGSNVIPNHRIGGYGDRRISEGRQEVTVEVHGFIGNERALAAEIRRLLKQSERRYGAA